MQQDIVLFLVGIVVGAMNAIAGGGMLLGFPVLLAVGMPALAANATANIIVLPGQIASAIGYRKYLLRIPRSYLLLLIPCGIGASIGAIVLRHTSYGGFEHLVPGLIIFAVALFALQPLLQSHLQRHMDKPSTADRPPLWLAFALLPLTTYGGYFGAGLGFVLLAFLAFTSLHDIHRMNALKNLVAALVAVLSIVFLYTTHLINWKLGLPMALGNLLGGYSGAVLAQRIPTKGARYVIIAIGCLTASYIIFSTYHL